MKCYELPNNALKTFKSLVTNLRQDDTITISVNDFERFVIEAINEAMESKV